MFQSWKIFEYCYPCMHVRNPTTVIHVSKNKPLTSKLLNSISKEVTLHILLLFIIGIMDRVQ